MKQARHREDIMYLILDKITNRIGGNMNLKGTKQKIVVEIKLNLRGTKQKIVVEIKLNLKGTKYFFIK